jgi:hypothetical protein
MNSLEVGKNIYLYFNLNDISYGSSIDPNEFQIIKVNNPDEVINYLFHNKVGAIDLNFINKHSKSDIYHLNLSIWQFNESHMEWIFKKNLNVTKFIEINELIK